MIKRSGILLLALLLPVIAQAGPREQLAAEMHKSARDAHINAAYIFALAEQESDSWPYTLNINKRGRWYASYERAKRELYRNIRVHPVAIGAMQIYWPVWGKRITLPPHYLLAPSINVRIGTSIFKDCLIRSKWHIRKALAMYHAGSKWESAFALHYADMVISKARKYNRLFHSRRVAMR